MKKIILLIYTIIFIGCASANAGDIDKPVAMAVDSVKLALAEKGVEGKLKVGINGGDKGFRLKNEAEAYEILVSDLNINEKTKFWRAVLSFTTSENKAERFNVTGSFERLITVPVLSKSMPRDTVIKEDDLTMVEVPASQVKFDTISEAEKLIGQSLKRTIADNMPLKARDLQKAQILGRNKTVNIIYNTPTISLKTIGIAMEGGGEGDIIKVNNSSSGKIIQAIVQDEQNVAAISQGMGNQTAGKTASIGDGAYVR